MIDCMEKSSLVDIHPMGLSGLLVTLGKTIDPALNQRVHALDQTLCDSAPPGWIENIPGYATLLVRFDPLLVESACVETWVRETMPSLPAYPIDAGRLVEVPVVYGGDAGPDLPDLARRHSLTAQQVVELHTAPLYHVYMMGFMPGFAYLGGLNLALATPRLEKPRIRVPAGSVGIAGDQTGVYPIESPGGWNLIGRTTLPFFDPSAAEPFLLRPGDRVRFIAAEVLDGA
jgi:inhibitor of KinA